MKTRQLNSGSTFREIYELLGDDKTGNIWVGENYSLKQLKKDMADIFLGKDINLMIGDQTFEEFAMSIKPVDPFIEKIVSENLSGLYED